MAAAGSDATHLQSLQEGEIVMIETACPAYRMLGRRSRTSFSAVGKTKTAKRKLR